MSRMRHGATAKMWVAPIALGVVTAIGLIAGLVGDGLLDAVAWIGLGLPLLVCVWFGWFARR